MRNGSRAMRTTGEMEEAKDVMYLVPARLTLVSFIFIGASSRASTARNHHQQHFALVLQLDIVLTAHRRIFFKSLSKIIILKSNAPFIGFLYVVRLCVTSAKFSTTIFTTLAI